MSNLLDLIEELKKKKEKEVPDQETKERDKDNVPENEDSEEDAENLEESDTHKWTKESIIEFLNTLDEEEIDELGEFIIDSLMYDEGTDVYDDFEDEDYDFEEELEESEEINEVKFFQKKKVQLDREKRKNVAQRKKDARLMKKYYKKNKARIKMARKKYIKRVKHNPNKIKHHKGVNF